MSQHEVLSVHLDPNSSDNQQLAAQVGEALDSIDSYLRRNAHLFPAPNELSLRNVSFELRYFADRSLYDALATIYSRNMVLAKRFTRNYTLDSIREAAEGSTYEFAPDVEVVTKTGEIGIAALVKVIEGIWTAVYSGIRDSYMLVNAEGLVDGYLDISTSESAGTVSIAAYGRATSINKLIGLFMEHFKPVVERTASRFELQGDGSIGSKTITLPDPKKYINGVYPNVPVTPLELLDEWNQSDSRCLLFWGPAGTGKSSFTTQMLSHRGYTNLAIVDDSQLYTNPMLITAVRELPDGSTVVFEDCDILLESRADGNKQMSALLGIISGISERKIQFVFITNLRNLNDVDEALRRPGRTHRAIEFRAFTRNEVNIVRVAIGQGELRDEIIEEQKEWTLAEIVHYGEGAKASKFGFNAN